jgi:hypothetical protein
LNEYTEWFTFESCDQQQSVYYEDALPLQLKLQEEIISPYPSYSACTPSSTNAQYPKGFMERAPFTPFSDDPNSRRINIYPHSTLLDGKLSFGTQTVCGFYFHSACFSHSAQGK